EIFRELHPKKSDAENNGGGEKSDQWPVPTFPCRVDSHGHGKAACQQHKHHRSSEIDFEPATSGSESGVIKRSIDDVTGEDATKEQHLGGEENPHAEIAGVALLFDIFELMMQRGTGAMRGLARRYGQRPAGCAF